MISPETLASAIASTIRKALEPRDRKFAALEQKFLDLQTKQAELEAKRSATWAGTWQDGKAFAEGSFITHRGSMWFAEKDTAARPGEPGSGWKLVVKSGGA